MMILMRKICLERNIPMWFYFQTQDDVMTYAYEKFEPEKVRAQIFLALLHGTVGLQHYKIYNGAITEDAERGPLFFFTKDINQRCHQLGKTLMALTNVGVFHSPEVLKGKKEFEAYRQSIEESQVLANQELPMRCSVGEFIDGEGNRYLMIQNRDYNERRSFRVKLNKKYRIYEVNQEDGKQYVMDEGTDSISVKPMPGDAILIRCQDAEEEAFLIDYVLQK